MANDPLPKPQAESPEETPAQRFVRLANPRVNRALKAVRIVGNLSSPAYHYTPEQVSEIIAVLREAVDTTEKKFTKQKPEPKQFSLGVTKEQNNG